MNCVVKVRLKILAKIFTHLAELDRISSCGDFRVAIVPTRQIRQRQPTRIVWPAVVGFKGGDQDAGHEGSFRAEIAQFGKRISNHSSRIAA